MAKASAKTKARSTRAAPKSARREAGAKPSPREEEAESAETSELTRTEIVIEMEDRPGVLASVGEILGRANVNIVAAAAFSYKKRGIIHLVVHEPTAALAALKASRVPVKVVREVMDLTLEDRPGELGRLARELANQGINISALYIAGERWGQKEMIVALDYPKPKPKTRSR